MIFICTKKNVCYHHFYIKYGMLKKKLWNGFHNFMVIHNQLRCHHYTSIFGLTENLLNNNFFYIQSLILKAQLSFSFSFIFLIIIVQWQVTTILHPFAECCKNYPKVIKRLLFIFTSILILLIHFTSMFTYKILFLIRFICVNWVGLQLNYKKKVKSLSFMEKQS